MCVSKQLFFLTEFPKLLSHKQRFTYFSQSIACPRPLSNTSSPNKASFLLWRGTLCLTASDSLGGHWQRVLALQKGLKCQKMVPDAQDCISISPPREKEILCQQEALYWTPGVSVINVAFVQNGTVNVHSLCHFPHKSCDLLKTKLNGRMCAPVSKLSQSLLETRGIGNLDGELVNSSQMAENKC